MTEKMRINTTVLRPPSVGGKGLPNDRGAGVQAQTVGHSSGTSGVVTRKGARTVVNNSNQGKNQLAAKIKGQRDAEARQARADAFAPIAHDPARLIMDRGHAPPVRALLACACGTCTCTDRSLACECGLCTCTDRSALAAIDALGTPTAVVALDAHGAPVAVVPPSAAVLAAEQELKRATASFAAAQRLSVTDPLWVLAERDLRQAEAAVAALGATLPAPPYASPPSPSAVLAAERELRRAEAAVAHVDHVQLSATDPLRVIAERELRQAEAAAAALGVTVPAPPYAK